MFTTNTHTISTHVHHHLLFTGVMSEFQVQITTVQTARASTPIPSKKSFSQQQTTQTRVAEDEEVIVI